MPALAGKDNSYKPHSRPANQLVNWTALADLHHCPLDWQQGYKEGESSKMKLYPDGVQVCDPLSGAVYSGSVLL